MGVPGKWQTKEHIWGGECVATATLLEDVRKYVKEALSSQEGQEAWKCVWSIICDEIHGTLALQGTILERHAAGRILVGLWSNDLQRRVKFKLEGRGIGQGLAGCMVEDMMVAHIQATAGIYKKWHMLVQVWLEPLTLAEEQAVNIMSQIGGPPALLTDRLLRTVQQQWYHGPGRDSVVTSWATQAAAEMEAVKQKCSVSEIMDAVALFQGTTRSEWIKKIRRLEDVYSRPGWYARQLLFWRHSLRKEWVLWLREPGCGWEELILHIMQQERQKGDKYGIIISEALQNKEYIRTEYMPKMDAGVEKRRREHAQEEAQARKRQATGSRMVPSISGAMVSPTSGETPSMGRPGPSPEGSAA